METRGLSLLRWSFAIGTIADALVAVNWFLIAGGVRMPNLLSGLTGSGDEYRFAMYIAALFMAGWSAIFAWGWRRPLERRGLLLITAVLLLISIVLESVFHRGLLGGSGLAFGIGARVALIAKFCTSYFYSRSGRPSR